MERKDISVLVVDASFTDAFLLNNKLLKEGYKLITLSKDLGGALSLANPSYHVIFIDSYECRTNLHKLCNALRQRFGNSIIVGQISDKSDVDYNIECGSQANLFYDKDQLLTPFCLCYGHIDKLLEQK